MKKRRFSYILLSSLIFFASCAWEDQATVTINLNRNDLAFYGQPVQKEFSLIDKFLSFLFMSREANAFYWDATHTSLSLTVSGSDMDTITAQIPGGATSYTVAVPSGSGRTFRILNTNGQYNVPVNWGGSVVVDLSPGSSVNISVTIAPMTRFASISAATGSLFLGWPNTALLGSFPASMTSVNQLKIYRSDSAEGPFYHLKTVAFSSGSTSDTGLLSLKKYYYRASIMTTYGEGELSDAQSGTPL